MTLTSMPEAPSNASPPRPPSLLKKHGLFAKKKLGQNFLVDLGLARRIVALAGLPEGETVVELGVGLGTLTLALAERASRVIGYEIDEELINILREEKLLPENVALRQGDILRLDYRKLSRELGRPLILFGNLPYYLSSRLLYRLLEEREALDFAVFMFQKEVVDRLLAEPGSREYGQLSVYLRLTCRAQRLLTLSPGNFYPPPEVKSSVIKIEVIRKELPHEETLKRLLKTAFSARRKKLAKNLTALGLSQKEAEGLLEKIGLSPNIRAEEVAPEKFLALAELLAPKDARSHQGA